MPYTTLSSGLTLQIPTRGSRSWADTILSECFAKISSHDHTGGGKGLQIGSSAISSSAITTAKIADLNVTEGKLADDAVTADKLATSSVTTGSIVNSNVTLAKVQDITSDRILGRDTAGFGVVEQLTVGGGIEFTGSGGIQRSALTGVVTASAGSGVTTIAGKAVTSAMLEDNLAFGTACSGVAGTALASLALLSQVQNSGLMYGGVAGGTVNAMTISVTPTPAAYANGQVFRWYTAGENTAAGPTLNVNSLGACTVVFDGGATIPAYYFTAGEMLVGMYVGGSIYLLGHKPPYFKSSSPSIGTQAGSLSGTATTFVSSVSGTVCELCFYITAQQTGSASAYWTVALPQNYVNVAYDIFIPITRTGTPPTDLASLMLPSGGGSTGRLYLTDTSGALQGTNLAAGTTYGFIAECIRYRTA